MLSELLLSSAGIGGLILLLVGGFLLSRYKRCPSNRILVIYGKVGKGKSAKCVHGGGAFVLPIIQDWKYLHLNPLPIEIDLRGALSKQNIRINTPSTFTVGISTHPEVMTNAAERLLNLTDDEIRSQAVDIILGQLRLVIATMSIEKINQDREEFLGKINDYVTGELKKVGLELINVNIRDITDESGYIEAIGKKAAAEAINMARVEVAQQEKTGAIGESKALREKEVQVAYEMAQSAEGQKDAEAKKQVAIARLEAQSEEGQKEAETKKRIAIADLESQEAIGEAKSRKKKEVETAIEAAESEQGQKDAESKKRIAIAEFEASAVEGENLSKAKVAEYDAGLAEKRAEAKKRSEVANAQAQKLILEAEKMSELARLEKDQIVQQEISKRKREISAEAQAEERRRIASGEADAVKLKYEAEAQGLQQLLDAKAKGYHQILQACGGDAQAAATLLLLEKMEMLVEKQTDAISNLKIDKITIWDGGANGQNGGNATSNFIKNFIGTLPPIHELAEQTGIKLPEFLGKIQDQETSQHTVEQVKELLAQHQDTQAEKTTKMEKTEN